jgi:serine/threonine protein phosphatase PrpC
MKVSSLTDKGLVYPINQDAVAINELGNGSLLVAVADGLNGQPAGDRAAAVAQQCVVDFTLDSSPVQNQLVQLFHVCDNKIMQTAAANPAWQGMAATLTAALIETGSVYWAHVGDCRLYLCRQQKLAQITQDDTLAAFLLAQGKLTQEQARQDSSRHGLFECLGRGDLQVKSGSFSARHDDLLLLSSDGLHNEIPEELMRSVLLSVLDLDDKLEQLVRLAKEAGGSDNITVIGVQM